MLKEKANKWKFVAVAAAIPMMASLVSTPVGAAARQANQPYSFTYMRPVWGPATYTKNGAYEQQLDKLANVNIKVSIIPVVDYDTKIKAVISSGAIPDVVWGQSPADPFWNNVEQQGAFLPINSYLNKYPAVKNAVPSTIWNQLKDKSGNIYFIPNTLYPIVPFPIFYRKDVFQKLGIQEPKTIAEFTADLAKLKKAYPKSVILTAGTDWMFKDLATAWGVTMGGYEPDPKIPKRIVPYWEDPRTINFYSYLQGLHKQGLLDPDYGVRADPTVAEQKFESGSALLLADNWSLYPTLVTQLKQVDPNAQVGMLSPLTGPAGVEGTRSVFPVDRGFYLSGKIQNPDRFFQFLNWTLTKGNTFRKYGILGKTYEVKNGQKVPIPDANRSADYKGPQQEPLGFMHPFSDNMVWSDTQNSYVGAGIGNLFSYVQGKFNEYAQKDYPDYHNPMVISPTDAKKGSQLYQDYLQPMINAYIMNTKLTRTDWVSAVQKWNNAGGNQIINEINQLQTDKSKPNYLK